MAVFSNVAVMLFLLISRMVIYIFLLLSITIIFYGLFENRNLINGSFCHFGWLWPQGNHITYLSHTVPLLMQGFSCYYLFGWYSGSVLIKACWQEWLSLLCLLLSLLVLHINSCCGTWAHSLCIVHVALQELQAVILMLHKVAFLLSGKVVALLLNSNTAKACLFTQDVTVCLLLSRLVCSILNMANKHGITLFPAYIHTHVNVDPDYLFWRRLVLEWYLLPHMGQVVSQLWGHLEVACSYTNQCQHYYPLENPLPMVALGLNGFSHLWAYKVSYVFPSPALVPLVLSKFLAEHVTGQLRHLILEASWLPTVLQILKDILIDVLL